jgi:hypothetical protein
VVYFSAVVKRPDHRAWRSGGLVAADLELLVLAFARTAAFGWR